MKLDVTQEVTKLDGLPMMIDQEADTALDEAGNARILYLNGSPKMKGGKPLTLERIITDALLSDLDEDKNKTSSSKIERARLADRIYGAKLPVELKGEDATLITDRVSKVWLGALVVYRLDCAITKAKALEAEVLEAEKKKNAPKE